jgi:ComF family protein
VPTIAKIKIHAQQWRDFILDLIFPVGCINCGRDGEWLCADCAKKLSYKSKQYCLGCKTSNDRGQFCPVCKKNYYLDGVMIAGDYDDKILALIIKHLKYHFIKDIAKILSDYMVTFVKEGCGRAKGTKNKFTDLFDGYLVIPVPLHRRRRLWRGFNQAQLIAGHLAQSLGLKTDETGLIRIRNNQPQAKLKEAERKNNIIGCFAWRGQFLNGANILIVDDVVTTGATLDECAKILKQNGGGKIWGLVAAKG